MNIETIEAIKKSVYQLNHLKGCVLFEIDNSKAKGQFFYSCKIKVGMHKEYLLAHLETLAVILGNLNGESLTHEIDEQRRILILS